MSTCKNIINYVKTICMEIECRQWNKSEKKCDTQHCIEEATPERMREINLAFLCETCGDNIVTNLKKKEDGTIYECNDCKGL